MIRRAIITGSFALLTTLVFAAPGPRSEKTEVTGTVVEYERRGAILVLSDFAGWDRKQMEQARFLERDSTRRWFDSVDKKHAVIYIKKEDLKGLRKGKKIKITGYSFFTDEWAVYPSYDRLEQIE
jgi:hypothetical protein